MAGDKLTQMAAWRPIAAFLLMGVLAPTAVTYGNPPSSANPGEFHPGYYAIIPSHQSIPSSVLISTDLVGMKIRYTWRDLETAPGVYDFSKIESHLEKLQSSGKYLWIQVLYVAWNSTDLPNVPEYMWDDRSYGGTAKYFGTYERTVNDGGWYPLFWNPNVRSRLVALYEALGARFNNEVFVEGIIVPETAAASGDGFDCSAYQETLRQVAMAAKTSFPDKLTMQMVNYGCFDIESHARWLESQGIGLGTPDTFTFKDDLNDTVFPLMREFHNSVPTGPDVQWSNYERNELAVRDIRDFAISATNPWYMFWRIREPYFSEEVLPAVYARKLPAAQNFYSGGSGQSTSPPKSPVLRD